MALLLDFLLILTWLSSGRAQVAPQPEPEPLIRVREESTLSPRQKVVTFGDIAEIRGLRFSDQQALTQIKIGNAPGIGEHRTFSNFALSDLLRNALSEREKNYNQKISLIIPSQVSVFGSPTSCLGQLAQTLREHYQKQCGDCELSVVGLKPKALILQARATEAPVTCSIQFAKQMPRGPFSLPLVLGYTHQPSRTEWLSGRLIIEKQVLVTTRAILPGDRLQANDLRRELRDVTSADDEPAQASEANAAVALRPITAGQVVWRSSLQRLRVLTRGDVVKLISGDVGWQVSSVGVAQSSGYIGDTVSVLNPLSKKALSGVVVERGVVRVQ